jgi:hypothetical protein
MVAHNTPERLARREADKLGWKIASYLMDFLLIMALGLATWAGKQLLDVQGKMSLMSQAQESTLTAVTTMQLHQHELAKEIAGLKEWRAETSSNRFTARDGREVWKEIASIRETIAKLSLVEPPTWLVDRIKLLEARLYALETRVQQTK